MTIYENSERSSVILILGGFLLGAGVALLLTPKTGPQFRQDLNRQARSARDSLGETVDMVKDQGKEVYKGAEEALQGARQAFESGRDRARDTVKEVKEKFESL